MKNVPKGYNRSDGQYDLSLKRFSQFALLLLWVLFVSCGTFYLIRNVKREIEFEKIKTDSTLKKYRSWDFERTYTIKNDTIL